MMLAYAPAHGMVSQSWGANVKTCKASIHLSFPTLIPSIFIQSRLPVRTATHSIHALSTQSAQHTGRVHPQNQPANPAGLIANCAIKSPVYLLPRARLHTRHQHPSRPFAAPSTTRAPLGASAAARAHGPVDRQQPRAAQRTMTHQNADGVAAAPDSSSKPVDWESRWTTKARLLRPARVAGEWWLSRVGGSSALEGEGLSMDGLGCATV